MENDACPFCNFSSLAFVAENDLAFGVRDKFPVRPLHMLLISKRHVADTFQTTAAEREAVHELASKCRLKICQEDPSVGGFNFGSNVGQVAGQKIFHAHLHLITARAGDILPPTARPNE
jgi:diadenosine tetraphosphate (Ap4A) HIT family hydrolase